MITPKSCWKLILEMGKYYMTWTFSSLTSQVPNWIPYAIWNDHTIPSLYIHITDTYSYNYRYIHIYIILYIYWYSYLFARAREGDYQRGLLAISAFIRAVKDEKARILFSEGFQWVFTARGKSLWIMAPVIAALIALGSWQFPSICRTPLRFDSWMVAQKSQLSFDIQSVNFDHSIGTTPWPGCACVKNT